MTTAPGIMDDLTPEQIERMCKFYDWLMSDEFEAELEAAEHTVYEVNADDCPRCGAMRHWLDGHAPRCVVCGCEVLS